MLSAFFVIAAGGAFGAVLRWLIILSFAGVQSPWVLGTLSANLLGGYLIGITLSVLQSLPKLNPLWQLFLVTGFLGGLTTFSSFTAELIGLLQAQRLLLAVGMIAAHVVGSLLCMALGILTVHAFRAY